jgi:hypothetical protein
MSAKHIEPALGISSFNCPYCGTLAHQTWFQGSACQFAKGKPPSMVSKETIESMRIDKNIPAEARADFVAWALRINNREIFLAEKSRDIFVYDVYNLYLSQCYSCEQYALWHADRLVYPKVNFGLSANDDLNADIKNDFTEATAILDNSPRGSAALLRLALQKLMKQIGESGENINEDIGSLVTKGLDVKIQKTLDLVRVIGNNAVHPGTIDMRDNRDTAVRLFGLINAIAYDRITHPKEVDALYESVLTPSQKQAITKRDNAPPKGE